MNESQQANLMSAGHFALGMIIALRGKKDSAAYFLAKALDDAGSESSYVKAIIAEHSPAETTPSPEVK